MTLRPVVTSAGDPAGTTTWTVTLTDNIAATASRSFTVIYTPPVSLSFTGLTPSPISTSAAGYQATLSATGTNFNNVTRVSFSGGPKTGFRH
jgi:hypothetical protein